MVFRLKKKEREIVRLHILNKCFILNQMSKPIIILLIMIVNLSYAQIPIYYGSQSIASFIPSGYEINLKYENDFNNDKIKDVFLILNSTKESNLLINNEDSISKRKMLILLGGKKSTYKKLIESDNIVPCKECGGKCDNLYSDISFLNKIFNYTTCNFPFASELYNISTYKLELKENKSFELIEYKEKYYQNAEDDHPYIILLNKKDLLVEAFNFYEFNYAQNNWADHITVSESNVKKLNDIAYSLLNKENYNTSLILLRKIIQKFPNRVVTYLNLADNYWAINDKDLAKKNYKKYIELMKSQNKDQSKIPQRVLERIK